MAFLLVVSVIFYFGNNRLMMVFTTDEGVIGIGAQWLRILSYSYFVYGWWMVTV
jgi:Na+-driven multidrug efflux pump